MGHFIFQSSSITEIDNCYPFPEFPLNMLFYSCFRHGAHNWEGPGALTAMAALDYLAQTTRSLDWIPNKANEKYVIFAGG